MSDLPFLEEEPTEVVAEPEQVEAAPEESKGEPEAAPPAEPKEDRHIPITALLDEREKRQAKEREAEELRRQLAELQAAQKPKPDFFDNPEAHLTAVQQQAQQLAIQTRLDISRAVAEDKFGAETVAAAYAFFEANPALSQPLLKSPLPFVEAVKVYQRHKAMEEIGTDPEAYRARIEEEVRQKLLAEAPKPKTPPPSIATAPGVSGAPAPATGFQALFGD